MEMPQKSIRQQKIYQAAHQLSECTCQVLSPCTFCNISSQFPFRSSAMAGCSKAGHFSPSMIPIALIEAITSPYKPCPHGILRSSWSEHHYHFPLLHIHLINTLPSFRCPTTLSSRRLPTALICRPVCPRFLQAHTVYHSPSHFSPQ